MKWNIELIKAKHHIEIDHQKQLAYYDQLSDTLVPMLDERLCPKDILRMEEWSQSDNGIVFVDCETHQIGLLIRNS